MNEMTFDEAIEALQHAVYGEEVRYAIARALVLSMNTQQSVAGKEDVSNKVTSISSNSTDVQYPSAKATYDALSNKEDVSNKVTSISSNSTDVQYPSAKAVYNSVVSKLRFDTTTEEVVYNDDNPYVVYLNAKVNNVKGIIITAEGNDFQCFFGRDGSIKVRYWSGGTSYSAWNDQNEKPSNKASSITNSNKTSLTGYPSIKAIVDYLIENYENLSNKKNAIAGNETSKQYYPTTKAVYDFGSQISSSVEDVKAYIGYTSGDILGLHADFENNVFTRLGAAAGLSAGSDFDAFPMYGQRVRVVVDSDGEIQTDTDPEEITKTDFDYDVMVYQPKFYYKVVPLKLEKQSGGLGYHIRKANYYITSTPHAGFKVHPLFIDKNGNEVDYVLLSAYEASYMYWHATSQSTGYYDIFHDGVDTDTTIGQTDTLKSLPNVKPISGQYKAMTKANMEVLAQRKSANWHLDTIKSVSANQLLMAIEFGQFNTQAVIGMGVVSNSTSGSNNCSSLTGSTAALGSATGMAEETIYDVAGAETPCTENGKLSVSYRGMENPWGNIWKNINGINLWGDGTMGGGQVYICSDFNFSEAVRGDMTINEIDYHYPSAGFTISNAGGWVSAFGYGSEQYDWLFVPSETTGNTSLPVGDGFWCTANLNNNYRTARFGGAWANSNISSPGGFYWTCDGPRNYAAVTIGGRLLYVPTATV